MMLAELPTTVSEFKEQTYYTNSKHGLRLTELNFVGKSAGKELVHFLGFYYEVGPKPSQNFFHISLYMGR